jgi:hypothetical protein
MQFHFHCGDSPISGEEKRLWVFIYFVIFASGSFTRTITQGVAMTTRLRLFWWLFLFALSELVLVNRKPRIPNTVNTEIRN